MAAATLMISDQIEETDQPSSSSCASESQSEVELIFCDCCSLTEECTPAYIEGVRERYMGKWICGLCAEAIKEEETVRSKRVVITTEEAIKIHINFCTNFINNSRATDPTLHLITAMRHIMRKSFESRSYSTTTPNSPIRNPPPAPLTRSDSCFPALTTDS